MLLIHEKSEVFSAHACLAEWGDHILTQGIGDSPVQAAGKRAVIDRDRRTFCNSDNRQLVLW